MIEHRLYSIEKRVQSKIVEQKILLCTTKHATMYTMQGYEVFDFYESLDMGSEYYERDGRLEIYNSRGLHANAT